MKSRCTLPRRLSRIATVCMAAQLAAVVAAGAAQSQARFYHSPWGSWDSGTGIQSLSPAPDGGYIAVGSTLGRGAILRLGADGTLQWSKVLEHIGPPPSSLVEAIELMDVAPTRDGGFVAVGRARVTGGVNGADLCVLRLDAAGGLLWEQVYGRVQGPSDVAPFDETPQRVWESDDGTITVTGTILFSRVGDCVYSGYESALAVTLDANGGYVAKHVLGGSFLGGPRHYTILTADGGFLVGLIHAYSNLGYTVTLQKYAVAGALIWAKAYYMDDGGTRDLIQGMPVLNEVTDDAGAGYLMASNSERGNVVLLRVDPDGLPLWHRLFKVYGPEQNNSSARVVAATPTHDAGLLLSIVSGYSPVWNVLLKTDTQGTPEWGRIVGDARLAMAWQTPAGGYFVAAGGYDVACASLGATAMLDVPCNALKIASREIVELTGFAVQAIGGHGPISCSAAVEGGEWALASVPMQTSLQYQSTGSCLELAIVGAAREDGAARLDFNTAQGLAYHVERREGPETGEWVRVPVAAAPGIGYPWQSVAGTGFAISVYVGPSGTTGVFRVVIE